MEKPHNPGLSDEAWEKLHKLIAKLNVKYATQINEISEKKGVSA